jgi:hypothetical protein
MTKSMGSLARKSLIVLGTAVTVAALLPAEAEARWYGCWGCGAFAAGAIAGAAIARPYAPPVYYAPPVVAAPAPVLVAPAPVVAPVVPICPALPPYPYYCR